MRRLVLPGLAACCLAMLVSCSASTNTASTDEKKMDSAPPAPAVIEPVSGKTAYWEMYKRARTEFATDLMPISLESGEIPGIKNADGKAALWTVSFVSESKKEMKKYTYAIANHPPDIYKGAIPGASTPWNGLREVMPYAMGPVQVDSDAALKSASDEAAAWLKLNPNEPAPTIALKESARLQIPTWIVTWGNDKKGFRALVNGIDGKPVTAKK